MHTPCFSWSCTCCVLHPWPPLRIIFLVWLLCGLAGGVCLVSSVSLLYEDFSVQKLTTKLLIKKIQETVHFDVSLFDLFSVSLKFMESLV
jgi:hypothetical protein